MATFVLVHGAYQGGWIWQHVAHRMRAAGHQVYAPSLDGCAERKGTVRAGITTETQADEIAQLRTRLVDDVSALNRLEPEMLDEDRRVRSRVDRLDANRLVIARGRNEEKPLRRNDAAFLRLSAAAEQGGRCGCTRRGGPDPESRLCTGSCALLASERSRPGATAR